MLKRVTAGWAIMMIGILVVAGVEENEKSVTAPVPTGEAGPKGLSSFYKQHVAWKQCENAWCGTIKVPLDYGKPTGTTVGLSVKVRPASSGDRTGAVFVNPGGPGGSGVTYIDAFVERADPVVARRLDVVGVDPRGVADSQPLKCLSRRKLDDFIDAPPIPRSEDDLKEGRKQRKALFDGCDKKSNANLARHVSSAEVARDFDIVRAQIGVRKISYYGASYGSVIGMEYLDRFPKNADRFVLDGPVDLKKSPLNRAADQARGLQKQFDALIKQCVGDGACPWARSREFAIGRIGALMQQLEAQPLPVDDSDDARELTEAQAWAAVLSGLYSPDNWDGLAAAIGRALNDDPSGLFALADRYLARDGDGKFLTNGVQVAPVIRCLDDNRKVTETEVVLKQREIEADTPLFAPPVLWSSLECDEAKGGQSGRFPRFKGADRHVLVVGGTGDPVTPMSWAKSVAKAIPGATLLTRSGDGHTSLGQGDDCVNKAISAYLTGAPTPGSDLCSKDL